jgi:hypothetical protein
MRGKSGHQTKAHPSSLNIRRTVQIRIAEQRLDRRKYQTHRVDWFPLVLNDVETETPIRKNVWMKHLRHKSNPRRLSSKRIRKGNGLIRQRQSIRETTSSRFPSTPDCNSLWILIRKLYPKLEDAAFPGGLIWANNCRSPQEKVVFTDRRSRAPTRRVRLNCPVVAGKA